MSGLHTGIKAAYAIGLDVGGTKVAAGVVTCQGEMLERVAQPTPRSGTGETTLRLTLQLVHDLRRRHPGVRAIGVGAAGMVDWPDGHVRWAPNNSYRDLPLRAILAAETGLPAVVDNDANAAAWAEACLGAGVGHRDLLVLTVGTGIGAGLILGGRLYPGATGIGGEAGHIIVDSSGPRCGCGSAGCLEVMGSGSALGRAGRDAALRDPDGMLAGLAGGFSSGRPGRASSASSSAAAIGSCRLSCPPGSARKRGSWAPRSWPWAACRTEPGKPRPPRRPIWSIMPPIWSTMPPR